MADASSLRSILSRIDGSAPAIHAAAGAMMKHYDRSTEVAVVEWRNAVHSARLDQLLPLLYVGNEVLQNSKRNRGNRFLEAFSPVLGQSLIHICQTDPNLTEKVRRTVKIWGDRYVFSIRFVNELLQGLERYRPGNAATVQQEMAEEENVTFSPMMQESAEAAEETVPSPKKNETTVFTLMDDSKADHDDDEDDDALLFADDNEDGLKLELDIDPAAIHQAATAASSNPSKKAKRRRSSTGSTGSQSSASKRRKRKSVLSTTSLMELWNQVASLQQSYDHSQAMISTIAIDKPLDIESLVGDELLEKSRDVVRDIKRVASERRVFHQIAQSRRALQQEAKRYLPFLENALKQDGEDIKFCDQLEEKIKAIQAVHAVARKARDERREHEAELRKQEESRAKERKEEEERKKFMESAMKKETEAKPGMVWNRATQEYQYLDTNEDWRD